MLGGSTSCWPKLRFLLLIIPLLYSCSSIRSGRYYKVNEPFGLDVLAKLYRTSLQDIRSANPGKNLEAGQWVFIPVPVAQSKSKMMARPMGVEGNQLGLIWPLPQDPVRLSSDYGRRGRGHHDGIDIAAPKGHKIVAAADGEVIAAQRVAGYGNMIIIDHGDFQTVYAHNSKNSVREGDSVKQGDVIGNVGRTGNATGHHLHFEVRRVGDHLDPLAYLPQDRAILRE